MSATSTTPYKKKLIEVALPLEEINVASAREKSIRHGHPSTLHLWWARRPLAAARAVIFAQMVDDPSAHPDLFPTEEEQNQERERLFDIIKELVKWESTTDEEVLNKAREEIWKSWRRTCSENADHPRADELFNPDKLPAFHDPFAGGGALPLEAQRLGMESYASDLNPVAVLINKAMIEIPPKFAGQPPVNPEARNNPELVEREWKGAEGLAEDVRYYGQWMRDEAEKRIGHLYPKVNITPEMIEERPDLKKYKGKELMVIAWLWARTVKSPNPAFADVEVPLVSNFMLSTRKDREAYVEPIIEDGGYRFEVRKGKPENMAEVRKGTSAGRRRAFLCLMSGTPLPYDYIREEGQAGRMGTRLMAIVAEGQRERVYLSPTAKMQEIAEQAEPEWRPETPLHGKTRVNVSNYGFETFGDLFSARQLVALGTFSDTIQEIRDNLQKDIGTTILHDDHLGLDDGGLGKTAYSEALVLLLALAIDKVADYCSTVCTWHSSKELIRNTFGRQAIPMSWDYAEGNPFSLSTGNLTSQLEWIIKVLLNLSTLPSGFSTQEDATTQSTSRNKLVSTDPPYYDNIGYADLSDYFYVWLRKSLQGAFQQLFATLAVPKKEELVATPYRHGSKERAEKFFLEGMTLAMNRMAELGHIAFPITIYYAFKQSETRAEGGTSSTGWETFLDALIHSGFSLCGTWPMRTELSNRMVGAGTNALASSIVLVCRKRPEDAPATTRRDFLRKLKAELPISLRNLQHGNIAPVDLAQAAIGPGMAVFTRFSKVLDSEGNELTVREALELINETLDEVLAEQEGDFDADTRWALAWFEQYGFDQGEYGVAETLSTAKNTSVSGMVEAGIVESKTGTVRLFKPDELPEGWDPTGDPRLTVWESVHQLIRALDKGEETAAELVRKLGRHAEIARELAYRLYTICERKDRAQDALDYNRLVQSWSEIERLAREKKKEEHEQIELY